MSKVLEKFKDLIKENEELVRMECRGFDDCGSLLLPKFDNSTLSLFLLSEVTAPDGFIENYSLSKINTKRLRILREMLSEDETLKEEIISIIEEKTSMPYPKFKKYDLGYQQSLVNGIDIEKEVPKLKKISINE